MAQLLTTSGGLSGQYQKYFNKKLLTPILQLLVMDQFAQMATLPPDQGAVVVRFTRPDSPDPTLVQSLSEGTPLSTDRAYTYSFVDATLAQVGQKTTISDILGATNLFDTLERVSVLMGQEAAHYYDLTITKEIVPNVSSASKYYGGGAADFATLAAASAGDSVLKVDDLNKAFTRLTLARAPKAMANERVPNAKGSDYVAIIPPQASFNVKQDDKFVAAGVRGNNEGLFNGEIGTWYGIRCITSTQPFIESSGGSEGTYNAAGDIFSTICMGSEQFGVVNLAAQSIAKPQLIVCSKPDKSDQLGQFTSVGWKAFFVVKTLKNTWANVIRTKTTWA